MSFLETLGEEHLDDESCLFNATVLLVSVEGKHLIKLADFVLEVLERSTNEHYILVRVLLYVEEISYHISI